ncbi:MAG: THUMP domain-containing protein, partial [Myxococcota bacterium]|nr:THUMP domain-containing protein [Myxococcota bacterium]
MSEPWSAFFVTCAAGTELALKDELRELRFRKVRADRGGVRFEGPWADGFRACLTSRIAIRVLAPIARFPAKDGDALYDGVRAIEWERWLSARHTLAVSAVSKASALTHTNFVAQRTKDAIVDRLRDLSGARPSVDRQDPDLAIFVHLAKDEAAVHLDLGGDSLHRRGWRTAIGEAPLKETLAAAMLRIAGWDREGPMIDPTCGSGTIAIEADLWARRVAPGLMRERFGIERWASHDEREREA